MIPLARPSIGPREEELVLEVLRSGQLSLGPMLPAFEEGFARRLGVAHASAVSSGTAGLHLALRAVGVTDGDEVVTSPFSFVASANAIVYERATPMRAANASSNAGTRGPSESWPERRTSSTSSSSRGPRTGCASGIKSWRPGRAPAASRTRASRPGPPRRPR